MADCLISFGSNLGNGPQAFAGIQDAFLANRRFEDVRLSNLHATRPIGNPDPQGNFSNAAIRLSTVLEPSELMHWLLAVERKFGRVRTERWGARTVDLDLLLYDRECQRLPIDGGNVLLIPHPRMSYRRFVLIPAAEVAADMVHPLADMTIGGLLRHLDTTANGIAVLGDSLRTQAVLAEIEALHQSSLKNRTAEMDYSYEIRTTIAPHEFPPDENRFAIAPVDFNRRWMDLRDRIKLLVYWRRDLELSENQFVRGVDEGFSGPRLELETDEIGLAAGEISSAMAAMLPSSMV